MLYIKGIRPFWLKIKVVLGREKLDELEPQWENMLAHQLASLPPIESFWEDLIPFFDWLEGQLKVERLVPADIVSGEIFQVNKADILRTDISVLLIPKIGAFLQVKRPAFKCSHCGKPAIILAVGVCRSISARNRSPPAATEPVIVM